MVQQYMRKVLQDMRKNVKIPDTLELIITEKFTVNPLHDIIHKVQMCNVVDANFMMILTVL